MAGIARTEEAAGKGELGNRWVCAVVPRDQGGELSQRPSLVVCWHLLDHVHVV